MADALVFGLQVAEVSLTPRMDICDSATGKVLRSIDLAGAQPLPEGNALTFTPDGKALATTYEGNDIRLIDFEIGKARPRLDGVARVGPLDRSIQGDSRNLLRSDTPTSLKRVPLALWGARSALY